MNKLLVIFLSVLFVSACKKANNDESSTADYSEVAQQVGDIMASIDESGGSDGSMEINSALSLFSRVSGEDLKLQSEIQPYAICGQASEFSSCSSNTITRTFGGCTLGGATFNGTVDFTWGGSGVSNCTIDSTGQHISRSPNFTVTGLRGATLTVSKTGTIGQRLTVTNANGVSSVFNFSNDGIRRTFTTAGGSTLLDFSTETTSDINVSGTTRVNRVISGGTLKITNHLTSVTCDVSPNGVTWNSAACNCARTGTWSGTCSDGSTYNLEITGCGTATLTFAGVTNSVKFDRCSGL